MIKLFIDTASNEKIKIGLEKEGKTYSKESKIGKNKSQIILPMIDSLLKKYKVKLEEIAEIEVNTGPGSYTGLRVGIAIANALSFALKIPVNGKKVGEIILPKYK